MSKGLRYSTVADLPPHLREQAAAQLAARNGQERPFPARGGEIAAQAVPTPAPKRQSKYNARRVCIDGEWFDSEKEARQVARLRAEHGRENIIRQVSVPLTDKAAEGERKMHIRLDVLRIVERFEDGTLRVEFVDIKGMKTRDWANKAKMLLDKHGIGIRLI